MTRKTPSDTLSRARKQSPSAEAQDGAAVDVANDSDDEVVYRQEKLHEAHERKHKATRSPLPMGRGTRIEDVFDWPLTPRETDAMAERHKVRPKQGVTPSSKVDRGRGVSNRWDVEGVPVKPRPCIRPRPATAPSHQAGPAPKSSPCIRARPATAPSQPRPRPQHPKGLRPASAPTLRAQKLAAERVRSAPRVRKQAPPMEKWTRNHHMAGLDSENALKPKGLRSYFSVPEFLAVTKDNIQSRPSSAMKGDDGYTPSSTFLSTDAEAPVCPARHRPGGNMLNRDGNVHGWNNRWNTSIRQNNDIMHPLHREYFTEASVFDHSASQSWRRLHHFEESNGNWVSEWIQKPPRFASTGPARIAPMGQETLPMKLSPMGPFTMFT